MLKSIALLSAAGAALLCCAPTAPGQDKAAPLRKVAIIVENHAGSALNDKVGVLEELLTSRIAGRGFSVISRDVVINGLKTYQSANVSTDVKSDTAVRAAAAPARIGADVEVARTDSAKVGVSPGVNPVDRALSDNTSALRLAQNLGVDYILIPSITSYGKEKKSYTSGEVKTVNTVHRLRVSYKIVEAGAGGAVKGGEVFFENTMRETAALQVDSTDTLDNLLADAATRLAEAIAAGADSLPAEAARTAAVNFKITCSMTDPRQQAVTLPGVAVPDGGKAAPRAVEVLPMDVTVELDGVVLGTAPGEFKAQPGLHKLRLTREGFSDWARTINVYEGQTLRVSLEMSEEGFARWKEATRFIANLDDKRKLTDAEAKRIEGLGKFLSESHYRVDTKENIQINKTPY